MIFNSFIFLAFFPIVALLFYLLPYKPRRVMLLAASYFFYMYWEPRLILLILFTTAVSYGAALIIDGTGKKGLKKLCLAAALAVCLGVLFFFKYFNFFAGLAFGIGSLFGGGAKPPVLDLILPVGISFYTFQTLSYVIDVYRGKFKPEKCFGLYALFVSFFPQLVAGPIERPQDLIPQLKADVSFRNNLKNGDVSAGLKLMALGFFKKIAVADVLALAVNSVYNSENLSEMTTLSVVTATALFGVQIYCDFSGYSTIALGCARVLGIKLTDNFNSPYSAVTIRDFWSRWHITLSTWFRDYLYIPLGGNRKGKARTLVNLMIVFLASGLWHGASLTFVIWGVLHGLYQVVGRLTEGLRGRLYSRLGVGGDSVGTAVWKRVFTFTLVTFAWMFFRANDLGDLVTLFRCLFSGGSVGTAMSQLGFGAVYMLTVIAAVISLPIAERAVRRDLTGENHAGGAVYLYLVSGTAFAWMYLLSLGVTSSFICFQF